MEIVVCNYCKKEFKKWRNDIIKNNYCSRECYVSYNASTIIIKQCVICGKKVARKAYKVRTYTTCSKECLKKSISKWTLGVKRSKEVRKKISLTKMGEKNPNWLGSNVGYSGIHLWVRRRLKNPGKCEACHLEKRLDLANISQEYKRELTDWEWLCRKCHMKKDGRLNSFLQKYNYGHK